MDTKIGTNQKLAAMAGRFGLLSLFWGALVGAETKSLLVGMFAVPWALAVSLALSPPTSLRIHPWPLLRRAPQFVWISLIGSLDVALRAVRPQTGIRPLRVEVPVALPTQASRLLLSSLISLVPGTLTVWVEEQSLTVHLLDARLEPQVMAEVRRLERWVEEIVHPQAESVP